MIMKKTGFTLLELIIVLGIIGVLGAIAYPLYNTHLTKMRRTFAITALIDVAGYMEEYYILHNNSYKNVTIKCPENLKKFYRFYATSENDIYLLHADPLGEQAKLDTLCGSLTLDQDGNKGIEGSGSVDACWY